MKELKITKRNLPHWTLEHSVYFITFRTSKGILSEKEKTILFDHIKNGHKNFYTLHSLVIMPDHVHLIIECNKGYPLPRIMKGIKGVSAYKINKARCTKGELWQQESFDRIIRNEKEYNQKTLYIYYNPFKKGLTAEPENYPWWYFNEEI